MKCIHRSMPNVVFPFRCTFQSISGLSTALTRSNVLLLCRENLPDSHMVMPSNTCFKPERHQVVSEVCFSNCSFDMLSAAVVPKTDCSFTHNICICGSLQPSALFVVELWPLSQQPPSGLVSTAASLPFDSTASFTAIALASSAAWNC